MKNIQKRELYSSKSPITDIFFREDGIFFDIETTGFSPASSICYLIGTLRKENNMIIIDQFLASEKEDEKEVILSFLNIIKDKRTIITFNGIGFDLPYIEAKCKSYGISFDFSAYQYLDIYKLVSGMKSLLKLQNYKQKTIEAFLHLNRDDTFSGGELISVYEEYVISQNEDLEKLLLLHNSEDVIGMLDLLPILTYQEILNGAYTPDNAIIQPYMSYEGESGQEVIITLKNDYPVPNRVSHRCGDFYITMTNDVTKICISVYEGTLRFFYPNYKEYFYLPKEDMAIHKSVACYVDKEFRQKANACNCYTRKEGLFLPQFEETITPVFRKEHKDKISYFEYSKEFISSKKLLDEYVKHIIKHMLSMKEK